MEGHTHEWTSAQWWKKGPKKAVAWGMTVLGAGITSVDGTAHMQRKRTVKRILVLQYFTQVKYPEI